MRVAPGKSRCVAFVGVRRAALWRTSPAAAFQRKGVAGGAHGGSAERANHGMPRSGGRPLPSDVQPEAPEHGEDSGGYRLVLLLPLAPAPHARMCGCVASHACQRACTASVPVSVAVGLWGVVGRWCVYHYPGWSRGGGDGSARPMDAESSLPPYGGLRPTASESISELSLPKLSPGPAFVGPQRLTGPG